MPPKGKIIKIIVYHRFPFPEDTILWKNLHEPVWYTVWVESSQPPQGLVTLTATTLKQAGSLLVVMCAFVYILHTGQNIYKHFSEIFCQSSVRSVVKESIHHWFGQRDNLCFIEISQIVITFLEKVVLPTSQRNLNTWQCHTRIIYFFL